jgi:hypothetical protein
MLLTGIKAVSKESLAPERALAKLRSAPGIPVAIKYKTISSKDKAKDKLPKPRSDELEKAVMATEDRLGRAFEELERRMTFGGARRRLVEKISIHPYRAGIWALFAGFAASLYFGRKVRSRRTRVLALVFRRP